MRTSRIAITAGLVLGGGIALVLWLGRAGRSDGHLPVAPSSVTEATPALRAAVPRLAPTPSAASPVLASLDPAALRALLDRHRSFADKALPLAAQRAELDALLSDPENIALVRARLLAAAPATFSPREEGERLAVVRFFTDALRMPDNPAHAVLVSAIDDVVLSGNHRTTSDERVRRSVVGDKIELFVSLSTYAATDAHELEARAPASANAAIVDYAVRLVRGSRAAVR